MKIKIILFASLAFFSLSGASRITVIVPIIQSDSNNDVEGFLYSISNIANFHELEILILKNFSARVTKEVINAYIMRCSNIMYIPLGRDCGIGEILNFGVKIASSPYISKAHIGNRYGAYFFEMAAQELDFFKDIDVVYSGVLSTKCNSKDFYQLYNESRSVPLKCTDISLENLSTFMWRKSLHKSQGYFNEAYQYLSDYEYWLSFPKIRIKTLNPPKRIEYVSLVSEPSRSILGSPEARQEYEKIGFLPI